MTICARCDGCRWVCEAHPEPPWKAPLPRAAAALRALPAPSATPQSRRRCHQASRSTPTRKDGGIEQQWVVASLRRSDCAAVRPKTDHAARQGKLHHLTTKEGGRASGMANRDPGADAGCGARRPHHDRADWRHESLEPASRLGVQSEGKGAALGPAKLARDQ